MRYSTTKNALQSFAKLTKARHSRHKQHIFPPRLIHLPFTLRSGRRAAFICTPTIYQIDCWLNLGSPPKLHSRSTPPWKHGRTQFPCIFNYHSHLICQKDGMYSHDHDCGGDSGTLRSSSSDKFCFGAPSLSAAKYQMRQRSLHRKTASESVWTLHILPSLQYTNMRRTS